MENLYPSSVKKERIVYIDIAKAICIILVVVGHYVPDNSPAWYVALHDIIYTFHMPLFMFASGYVYIATKKDVAYGAFLWKKVRRLMVPYISTSIIVITIKLITQGSLSVDAPVTFLSYLKMFYSPEAGAFLWFIWALWWMFVIVPLFKTAQSRLLLFLVCLVIHYVPMNITNVFCIASVKNMFVFFMLGIVTFEHKLLQRFVNDFSLRKSSVIITLFLILQSVNLQLGEVKTILLPYIGIFFILEVSNLICHFHQIKAKSLLLLISASSYIIYLFHTTFEGFAKAVCRKLPFDSDLWYVFVPEALAVITCGVVVPIILFKVFKRYKVTKVLFGL